MVWTALGGTVSLGEVCHWEAKFNSLKIHCTIILVCSFSFLPVFDYVSSSLGDASALLPWAVIICSFKSP